MKVLMLDNYDSFTYNLVHILRRAGVDHEVHRNDKIGPEELDRFDKIILSPGPGIPSEAGRMSELIRASWDSTPILGICLGHQAIAEHLGATLVNMDKVYHGVSTAISLTGDSPLFKGVPKDFEAGRYHSWKVDAVDLPSTIEVIAKDEEGDIMAIQVKERPIYGIQFHPESVMTAEGPMMIRNFLEMSA